MAMEDTNGLVTVLSNVLCQLVGQNDQLPLSRKNVTIFHAQRPPTISIKSYLERIVRYSPCSTECYVLALIYIDRIIQQNNTFQLTSLNAHRLLITSVLIASKFFDDTFYNNSYYSRVGGITCVELNALELEFLFLINFNLSVSPDMFNCYSSEMTKHLNKVAVVQPVPFKANTTTITGPAFDQTGFQAGLFNEKAPVTTSNNKRKEERKDRKPKKQKTEAELCVLYNNNNNNHNYAPFNFQENFSVVNRKRLPQAQYNFVDRHHKV